MECGEDRCTTCTMGATPTRSHCHCARQWTVRGRHFEVIVKHAYCECDASTSTDPCPPCGLVLGGAGVHGKRSLRDTFAAPKRVTFVRPLKSHRQKAWRNTAVASIPLAECDGPLVYRGIGHVRPKDTCVDPWSCGRRVAASMASANTGLEVSDGTARTDDHAVAI